MGGPNQASDRSAASLRPLFPLIAVLVLAEVVALALWGGGVHGFAWLVAALVAAASLSGSV